MFSFLKYGKPLKPIVEETEKMIDHQIKKVNDLVDYNQAKVLNAFKENQVSDFHLNPSTGYGYDDIGRETLDKIYAKVFGGEAAIVRPHIVSGTHALSIGLFGLLRPGDELLYITGTPYDTLEEVIGIYGENMGSLKEWGISYQSVSLLEDGSIDYTQVANKINSNTKVIAIQRSSGYSWRSSFSVNQIGEMVRFVKEIKSDVITFVDNCYGEFTEQHEPTDVGADVIVGSLIKNPGGGLAKSGGYFVGKEEYIQKIAYRLTAPGIGAKVGAMHSHNADFYQGLFLAPHMVGEAIKGSIFAAALLEKLGFETNPKWDKERYDIIQSVKFDHAEQLITFIQGIQMGAPVDAHVTPEPSQLPGYQNPVIMAAGTFIQGASLELSGDAPIREPYIGYIQGGLTYQHVKWGILTAVENMVEKKAISIEV